MEITGKKLTRVLNKQKVELKNESEFKKDLIRFVDILENDQTINQNLYNKLINCGINKIAFEDMISRIKVFSSYDDDEKNINFPYEDWIPQLLSFYTEEIK